MSQTTYSQNMSPGIAGGRVYSGQAETIVTYNNPADEIGFGRLVQKISGDANGVELLDSVSGDQLGVAVLDQGIYADEATAADSYPIKSAVAVASQGVYWVEVDQNVTPDSDVYARIADTLNVQTITFNADFVTGNSIAWSVNGVSGTPVAFNTDHNTTIAALAAAIQGTDAVLTATTPGGGSRVITVTSSNANAITFVITATGGAGQPVDTVATTVAGDAGTDQGIFRADSDSNLAVLVSDARYLTSASSGGFAALKINKV